jgi:hypothetical protein
MTRGSDLAAGGVASQRPVREHQHVRCTRVEKSSVPNDSISLGTL